MRLWSLFLLVAFFPVCLASADFKLSGFGTAGAIITDSKNANYDYRVNSQANYNYLTKFGLNFRSNLSENWFVSAQILAKDQVLDTYKNSYIYLDYVFAGYRPVKLITIKAGRQKLPLWLISDYYDIGVAYPWTRPPVEVYSLSLIKNIQGVSVSFDRSFASFAMHLEGLFGESQIEGPAPLNFGYLEGVKRDLLSVNAKADFEWGMIRMSFTRSNHATADVLVSNPLTGGYVRGLTIYDAGYRFFNIGTKAKFLGNASVYSEYAHVDILYNGSTLMRNNAVYITTGYTMWDFLTPHFTYALLVADTVGTVAGFVMPFRSKQQTLTLGLNFKTTDYSVLKIDVSHINIPAAESYNGSTPPAYLATGTFSSRPGNNVTVAAASFDFMF
jgi:hypothetical protein